MTDGPQRGAERARRTWGHQDTRTGSTGPKAPIFFPEPTDIDPPPLGLRLEALKQSQCHWVIGETHTYCGQPTKAGSSYCAGHHAHVYVPKTYPINEGAIMARLDMYGPINDAAPIVPGSGNPVGAKVAAHIPADD